MITPDNYTRFWVMGKQPSAGGSHTSLAFSTPANVPGALAKPLQVFASRGINLSRIESRPTKRSLGEYLFFIDLQADASQAPVQDALSELALIQKFSKSLAATVFYQLIHPLSWRSDIISGGAILILSIGC
jgi:prephenate dehydratase